MKKFILSALVAVASISANAQAQKGDLQTSVGFTPFEQEGNMFKNSGLNVAYYLTDKDAVRIGLNFNTDSNKKGDAKKKETEWSISLGYENHFKSYKNIDLYAGGELSYGALSLKNGDLKAEGAYGEFGIHAFTGINVYVYKQLYLGAEIQLGYSNISYSKYEDMLPNANGDLVPTEVDPKKSSSEFNIGVKPALRLGWTF